HEHAVTGERSCARSSERAAPDNRQRKQKPLAAEAVAERSRERRDRRGRQQPDKPGYPDRRRAASLIGKHTERNEVSPLSGNRAAPGELHPPHVIVPNSRAESRDHLARANHSTIESLSRPPNKVPRTRS